MGLVWGWGDGSGISRYGSGWVFDTSTYLNLTRRMGGGEVECGVERSGVGEVRI